MIDRLFSHVAPHLCCGCGKTGTLLCDNCKYDINNDYFEGCIVCGGATGARGKCLHCKLPYSRAWCVGERSGELRKLIDDFKFENARAAHVPLAELLMERIGQLPPEVIIVPVPTISSHIRQRGYDHTLLIARLMAKQCRLHLDTSLYRATSTRQRDASRKQRIEQAKAAFAVRKQLRGDQPYLLIDDVITTGSTLKYAAEALRAAGAKDVWVAAIARQPLD